MTNDKEFDMSSIANFISIGAVRGFTAISQIIIVAVASQVFDKSTFGRFAIALAAARLLSSASGLGASSFLLKDIPYRQQQSKGWHRISSALLYFLVIPLIICILFAVLLEGLAYLEAGYYPLKSCEGAAVSALGFLWANMMALGAYVRVQRSGSEAMVVSELIVPSAVLCALGVCWLAGSVSVVAVLMFSSALLLLVQLIMVGWHIMSNWIPVGGINSEKIALKDLIAYWGTVVLNTMTGQLDIVLAGTIISPATVGIYVILKRISNMLIIASSIVVWMLAPVISRASAAGNHAELHEAARRAMQLTIAPALVITIFIVSTVPIWTAYFDLQLNQTFYVLFVVMMCSQLISVAVGSTIMFATQTGMPGIAARALFFAILVAAPLILIGGSLFEIVGVAIAQLTMILLMKLPVHHAIRQRHGIDVSVLNLFKAR